MASVTPAALLLRPSSTVVPVVGKDAGSPSAALNPFSPQSLATRALTQQVQATSDTKYDPAVPQAIPGVVDGFSSSSEWSVRGEGLSPIWVSITVVAMGIIVFGLIA